MIIVADTSAMYAAFDDSEPEHDEAKEIMERDALVISDLVLTEIDSTRSVCCPRTRTDA